MIRILSLFLCLCLVAIGGSVQAKVKSGGKRKSGKTAVRKHSSRSRSAYKVRYRRSYKAARKAPARPQQLFKDTARLRTLFSPTLSSEETAFIEDNDEAMGMYAEDPTFDAFGLEDTININPYRIDLSKLADSISIRLQDQNQCDYVHPFKGNVTSGFGFRWGRPHLGYDIDLETGDSVRSAFEGTVRIARRSPSFGYVVMVRHKNGLETIYAHLSQLAVRPGDHVEAGDLVGLGGNTGHSFGSHLHFEVRYKGMPLDPSRLISFTDFCLNKDEVIISRDCFDYWYGGKHSKGAGHVRMKYYRVRKGDSLSRIARKLGTTTRVLQRLNKLRGKTVAKGKLLRYI